MGLGRMTSGFPRTLPNTLPRTTHAPPQGQWQHGSFHGQGEWHQARSGLTYRGEFVGGRPALVPQQLTVTWVSEEDPKATKAKKPPAKGAEEEAMPLPVGGCCNCMVAVRVSVYACAWRAWQQGSAEGCGRKAETCAPAGQGGGGGGDAAAS